MGVVLGSGPYRVAIRLAEAGRATALEVLRLRAIGLQGRLLD